MCVCVRVCVSRLSGNECVKITLDAVNFGQWLRFSRLSLFFSFFCLIASILVLFVWLCCVQIDWLLLKRDLSLTLTRRQPKTHTHAHTHNQDVPDIRYIWYIHGFIMRHAFGLFCLFCTLLTFAYTWLCFVNLRYQATYHYSSKTGRESERKREREKIEKLNSSLV